MIQAVPIQLKSNDCVQVIFIMFESYFRIDERITPIVLTSKCNVAKIGT